MATGETGSTAPAGGTSKYAALPRDTPAEKTPPADDTPSVDKPAEEKFAKLPEEAPPSKEEAPKADEKAVTKPATKEQAKAVATKRAVVAGINAYPPPNELPSCVADAQAFANLLRLKFGFTEIRTILDEQVTVAEFERQLDWLFEGATPESRLVLYYSGHGYAGETQPGVIEEFLVLFDNFLQDNRLVQKAQNLPPGVLTVVLDSCFSGGMEKPLFVAVDLANAEVAKVKRLLAPPELLAKEEDAQKNMMVIKPFGGPAFLVPKGKLVGRKDLVITNDPNEAGQPSLNALLVSACLETETAAASTARTNGLSAFTCCLLKSTEALGMGVSTRQLIERSVTELRSLGFRQTPQIKEASRPGNLANQPFINFAVSGGAISAPGGGISEDLLSFLQRTIEEYLKPKGDGNMLPSTVYPGTQFGGVASGSSIDAQKAWWNDVISAVVQVLPVVIDAVSKSKGPMPAGQFTGIASGSSIDAQKAWWNDVISAVVQVLPVVIDAVSKSKGPMPAGQFTGIAPGSSMDAQKAWWNDVISAVVQVLPVVIDAVSKSKSILPMPSPWPSPWPSQTGGIPWWQQLQFGPPIADWSSLTSKGPGASMDAQKAWWNDVINTVVQVLPVVIDAVTKSKSAQFGGGVPAYNPADQEKFWGTLIPILISAVPAVIDVVDTLTKSKSAQFPVGVPGSQFGGIAPMSTIDQKWLDSLIPVLLPTIIDLITKSKSAQQYAAV